MTKINKIWVSISIIIICTISPYFYSKTKQKWYSSQGLLEIGKITKVDGREELLMNQNDVISFVEMNFILPELMKKNTDAYIKNIDKKMNSRIYLKIKAWGKTPDKAEQKLDQVLSKLKSKFDLTISTYKNTYIQTKDKLLQSLETINETKSNVNKKDPVVLLEVLNMKSRESKILQDVAMIDWVVSDGQTYNFNYNSIVTNDKAVAPRALLYVFGGFLIGIFFILLINIKAIISFLK